MCTPNSLRVPAPILKLPNSAADASMCSACNYTRSVLLGAWIIDLFFPLYKVVFMLRKTKPNGHHETSAQQYYVKGHTTESASVKHALVYLANELSYRDSEEYDAKKNMFWLTPWPPRYRSKRRARTSRARFGISEAMLTPKNLR